VAGGVQRGHLGEITPRPPFQVPLLVVHCRGSRIRVMKPSGAWLNIRSLDLWWLRPSAANRPSLGLEHCEQPPIPSGNPRTQQQPLTGIMGQQRAAEASPRPMRSHFPPAKMDYQRNERVYRYTGCRHGNNRSRIWRDEIFLRVLLSAVRFWSLSTSAIRR